MKNIFITATLLLMGTICSLSSCKSTIPDVGERGTLEVSASEVALNTQGGNREIEVKASDGVWQLVPVKEDWIEATTEDNRVLLNVQENKLNRERTAEVIIHAPQAKLTRKVVVRQFGVTPALHVEQNQVVFDRLGGEQRIQLTVNGSDWTVSSPYDVPWLHIERNTEARQLILSTQPIDKDSEDSGQTRSTMLILSYGTSHHILNVRQDGWQTFPIPELKPNATRSDIVAHAEANGFERNSEFEEGWREMYGEDQTRVVAYNTTALEGSLIVYYFDDNNPNVVAKTQIRAKKGHKFDETKLAEWLQSNNFNYATETTDGSKGLESFYYNQELDYTTLAVVNNSEKYYTRNPDYNYQAAVIDIKMLSNQAVLNPGRSAWLNLPIRNSIWIDNPEYKQAEVIAYEEARGMVFNPVDENTKKNDIPGYQHIEYKEMAFLPKDENAVLPGDVRKVVYRFNIPGWIDSNFGKQHEFISNDPALAGSVAQRLDLYEGENFLIQMNRWSGEYMPKSFVISMAKMYGFKLAESITEYGFFYFIRETDKQIMYLFLTGSRGTVSFGTDEALYNSLYETLNKPKE